MKTLRELSRDVRFSLSAAVLLALAVLALCSFFSPYDPKVWRVVPRDMRPSWKHLLGTTSMGQDVFWQMTFAIRNSIAFAFVASVISRAIAVTVGLVAGYRGRLVDRVLMFFSDGLLVVPTFLILMLLAMMVEKRLDLLTLALVVGLITWAWDSRVIRSQILSLREREFTYTAVLSGVPVRKLIFNEYLSFIAPLVFATFINNIAFVIGMEMTLAVLGLTDLSIPTLGSLLQWSLSHQSILLGLWWWIATPVGVAVSLFVSLYMLSVSISRYLDPRARVQRIGAK